MPFNCTICGEESTRICVWCTKDTCANHLCEKCGRCSDCCECEVPLNETLHESVHMMVHPHVESQPEPPHPSPDPDPFPEEPGEPAIAELEATMEEDTDEPLIPPQP
jgi:hypothetical protein